MNIEQIVRRVRNSAGDTAALQFTNETLNDWINSGTRECAVENSLYQKSATANLVVGQAEYTLPTDIYKLHSVTVNNAKIEIKTLQEFEQFSDQDPETSTNTGTPVVGYIWANKLTVYPAPDVVKAFRINYTADPADIDYDGGSPTWEDSVPAIPASYHERLVIYCLAQVAMQDDDIPKYQALMAEFTSGVINTKHQGETQEDLYPFISVSTRDGGLNYTDYDEYIY